MRIRLALTHLTHLTAVAALSLALSGCSKLGFATGDGHPAFKGVDVTGADYHYALPDATGKMRTPADFKGKVTAVFFGYTQCPDVCPTELAELSQIKKSLGKDSERFQTVFITVDPERDTPEVLKAYVGGFDPEFVALRGSLDETKAAANSFKVFFAKAPGRTPGSYTMDHSAGTYLFDAQGRVRLYERYGGDPKDINTDVKTLLEAG